VETLRGVPSLGEETRRRGLKHLESRRNTLVVCSFAFFGCNTFLTFFFVTLE